MKEGVCSGMAEYEYGLSLFFPYRVFERDSTSTTFRVFRVFRGSPEEIFPSGIRVWS